MTACTFSDLGPGYHLVPVRDVDHVRTSRWSVRVWVQEDMRWSNRLDAYESCGPFVYQGSQLFDSYADAKAYRERELAYDAGAKVVIYSPRNMRRAKPARPALHEHYDAMAIQAGLILRDVLRDLRTSEEF